MRAMVLALLIGSAVPLAAQAAERPGWAFPVTDKVQPAVPADNGEPKTAPPTLYPKAPSPAPSRKRR